MINIEAERHAFEKWIAWNLLSHPCYTVDSVIQTLQKAPIESAEEYIDPQVELRWETWLERARRGEEGLI